MRISGGSVIGREHVRLSRNAQDGLAWHTTGDLLVGAVTDGCSAAPESEAGARLGAAWLAANTPRLWPAEKTPGGLPVPFSRQPGEAGRAAAFARALEREMLAWLERSVMDVTPPGGRAEDAIGRFFLFGFLLVVMDPQETVIVGAGDGLFAVNGSPTMIEPGEGNAPDYVAYGLVDPSRFSGGIDDARAVPAGTSPARIRVHAVLPTESVRTLLLATDGILPLFADRDAAASLFADGGRLVFADRPRALQKKLNVLGARPGLLADDTTILHLERRQAP